MLVKPLMTNLKMTVMANSAVSACSPTHLPPPSSVYKSSCPTGCQRVEGVGLWTNVHHYHPQVPAAEIKQLSFSPTWPVYWLLSGEQPDPIPFSNNNNTI